MTDDRTTLSDEDIVGVPAGDETSAWGVTDADQDDMDEDGDDTDADADDADS